MTFSEIEQEIRAGKNLDIHIKSESKFVRKLVAEQRYQLNVLANDPSEEVRAAVARQGYALNQLRNDKSDWVKFVAMEMLEQHRQHNAGYDIINRIELGDNHFVVGHNPKAPAQFATWQYFADRDYYYNGHYFTEKDAAVVDMFKRAGEQLQLKDQSLGLSLLTEQDYVKISDQETREAICFGLESVLDGLDLPENQDYDIDALLHDDDFMRKAIYCYQNIDHTQENEALADSLQNLLDEFPQHKRSLTIPNPEPIRLAPEEVQFLNTLLQYPSNEIPKIFGPFGDNFTFQVPLENGMTVTLEIAPTHSRQNPLELSASHPHLNIIVTDKDGFKIYGEAMGAMDLCDDEHSTPDLTGSYTISIEDQKITVTLEEDKSLRRIGNQFIFRSTTEEDLYGAHNNELCTIKRGLTPQECDILITGLMWEAEFANGDRLHVFDHELEQPERGERKPSLEAQVKSADARQAQKSPFSADRPEKDR